ncbi:MAG: hypothetical protein K1X53_07235 [Candidatus Sumerlaeaceae bacterium]|nr:hypothetical protein [Candidatus Sumerlaeaceae bacterium]
MFKPQNPNIRFIYPGGSMFPLRRIAPVAPRHPFWWGCLLLICLAFLPTSAPAARSGDLPDAELERIGRRIWQNECNGSVDGLTSWNTGEDFASLGIGHFIWYPAGPKGPFEESFPMFVSYMQKNGGKVPAWISAAPHCPWPTKAAFQKDRNSDRAKELRIWLAATVKEQTRFIIQRLDQSTARMEAAAGKDAAKVRGNIALLRLTAAGNFAMIDYVNFKGDGLNESERYKGEGWGLLQVLITMRENASSAQQAPRAFADAAKIVLTRRVKNSPPERKEQRWLQGWLNRCETYAR